MKKILVVVLLACLLPSVACATNYNVTDMYALTTMIVEVNKDYVVCLDFTGNEWMFDNVNDWSIGDIASLLMWSNGTDMIEDDVIVQTFYGGHVPN